MKKIHCALSLLLAGLLFAGTFSACKEPNVPAQTEKQTETDKPSETDVPGTSKPEGSEKPTIDTEKPTTDTKKPSRPEKPAIEETEGLEYQLLEDGTYEVSGVGTAGNLSKIVIPAVYNGKAVTIIGNEAFSGCETLTSITIPDSVTIIYSNAFFGCTNLTQKENGDSLSLWTKRQAITVFVVMRLLCQLRLN